LLLSGRTAQSFASDASAKAIRSQPVAGSKSRYVVGPVYDWLFFLLPPIASLVLGIGISGTTFSDRPFQLAGREVTGAKLMMGILVHAHLVAVLVRSHGNDQIRRLHPVRFWLVPIVLWLAILSSPWIAVSMTIVATFWDVWHSGAQTFGFVRLYDRNIGNSPAEGRRLDFWLNQLLYAGPILAGATLLDHLEPFEGFHERLGNTWFCAVPAFVEGRQRYLTWAVLAGGTLFVIYYVIAYLRLSRRGYRVSFHKVFLLASTGMCSIYTWGLNSWGEAFFIMNLFHAVQYLALVWAIEHRQVMARVRFNQLATWALYLVLVLGYGAVAELSDPNVEPLWAATIVVSIMHFWYDGFIWSVRRRQV
jgi:hypothetical protein